MRVMSVKCGVMRDVMVRCIMWPIWKCGVEYMECGVVVRNPM